MNPDLSDPAFWHRLQFAFTVIYHYLFPQLTMGLAWFIVFWKWKALRTGEERYAQAARFWAKIFGLNFAVGVVTGIPMEFQFGTNWAAFSKYSGEVIGQTLAMEGMFAFLLESAMIGALVWGEKRLGPRNHFLVAVGVAVGSWVSAYFILVTNAFMQHPVGYAVAPDGSLHLANIGAYLLNPWAWVEFAHNQAAALVTGSFVVTALGAFYMLGGQASRAGAALFEIWHGCRIGGIVPRRFSDRRQAGEDGGAIPGGFAGGDGGAIPKRADGGYRFDRPAGYSGAAPGQSDRRSRALSFLAYGTFHSDVRGLDAFPEDTWPDNIELLYYSFHIMAGLGTMFIAIMALARYLSFSRASGIELADALGFDAGVSVSLHREHRGLDDGRIGSPAVACLWTCSARGRGISKRGQFGQRRFSR